MKKNSYTPEYTLIVAFDEKTMMDVIGKNVKHGRRLLGPVQFTYRGTQQHFCATMVKEIEAEAVVDCDLEVEIEPNENAPIV